MRDFETYKELLSSLKTLRKTLKAKKSECQKISDAGLPEMRSVADFRALNVVQLHSVRDLERRIEAAHARFTPLAKILAGPSGWGKMDFARRISRAILKILGLDALALAQSVARAEANLARELDMIEAAGMRAEEMTEEEFGRLAADWYAYRRPLIETFVATQKELDKVKADIAKLDQLEEAIKARRAPLSGLAFSSGYIDTVRQLDEFSKAGKLDQALSLFEILPVRTLPSDRGRDEIRTAAKEIAGSWNGKGLFNPDRNQKVAGEIAHLVQGAAHGRGWPVNDFEDVSTVMSEIGVLKYDIQVALYWLGLDAERRILHRVPGIENEVFYNSGLIQQLHIAAEKQGLKLFQDLGYTLGFPFEIAFWDTGGKKSETFTGADMCIILYITLEDGTTLIRGALLQGKLSENLVGKVHRTNETLGKNHQLISLTSGEAVAYYTFYHNPYDTIGITVVPAARVRAAIEAKLPRKMELWEIPPADCVVPTDENASDFASFLAITLMDAKHHFDSIEIALKTMGEGRKGYEKENGTDVVKELALNLALISVGGPVPAAELEPLKKYGFRETEERASRWAPHPQLKR